MYPWSGKHLLAIAQNAEAIKLKDLHIWQPNKKRNGNNLDGGQSKAKANKKEKNYHEENQKINGMGKHFYRI